MPGNRQRTLLLTGASRGIGHATVKHFSAAGWRVLTVSRQAFSEDCPWDGGAENHIQLDLADLGNLPAAIDDIRSRLGDGMLDAMVNNAAISPKGEGGSRLGVMGSDREVWEQVFNVNFFSTALLIRGLIAELAKAKGAVINVTSIAGMRVHPFAGSAYATSKAALSGADHERWHGSSGRWACASTRSRQERSTRRSCRRAQKTSSRTKSRSNASANRKKWRPRSTSYARAPASYVNGAEVHINGGQHV